MKESPIGRPEASTTNFQEAPRRQTPTMDELRNHRARVNETRGKLFGAQRAYEEAAVPNKENVRADAAYSEYLQEVVPVTNISGASRASRRNIIDGRATYETDLNKQVADAEAASAAAEQEEEPFTLLGIGEKKHNYGVVRSSLVSFFIVSYNICCFTCFRNSDCHSTSR